MSHKRPHGPLATAALAALLSGCAGRAEPAGVGQPAFPTRQELAAIAARAPPAVRLDGVVAEASTWTLAGPLPDRIAEVGAPPGQDAVSVLVRDAVGQRSGPAVMCAARELARFVAEHGSPPEPRLRGFIYGRCGMTQGDATTRWVTWDDIGTESEAEVLGRSRDRLIEMGRELTHADGRAGGGYAVQGKRAVFLWVAPGFGPATLDPGSQLAVDGAFVVSGIAAKDVALVSAVAAQGKLAASPCTRDASVVLPRFSFRCAIHAGDATAWVQLFALERGRQLATGIASVLSVGDPAASATWTRVDYAPATPMPEHDPALALLALVNTVRVEAGHGALMDLAAQRATTSKIAPHYFSAAMERGDARDTLDFICLGLMAGWDVDEMVIGNGSFASLMTWETARLDQLLGAILDAPSSRWALLDPKLRGVALALLPLGERANGLLIASYAAFERADPAVAAADLFRRLDETRLARAAPPLGRIPAEGAIAEASAALAAGAPSHEVMDRALERVVKEMNRPMQGWFVEVQDIADVPWPVDLVSNKKTYVSIAVASRKDRGAAWGSHAVLVIGFVDESGTAKTLTAAVAQR